jgi:ubiquitin carboxyl-terminal hydrolase 4/11/15
VTIEAQLPTPPNETTPEDDVTIHGSKFKDREVYGPARPPQGEDWLTPRSHNVSNGGSMGSSPPQLDEIELSTFDTAPAFAHMSALNDLLIGPQFNFPDPSSKASPTSSNEAEPDLDDDRPEGDIWPAGADQPRLYQHVDAPFGDSFSTAMPWNSPQSPHGSATSDPNPFTDVNAEEPHAEGSVIDDSIAPANGHHPYDVSRVHDETSEMLS